MLVPISEIKIASGRREVRPEDAKKLADSITQIGLLNPITITPNHTLIAGNHRLEAAKLLGWTRIECTICDVNGLLAELAEIDENFVRKNLSPIEFGDLLLRRKEIFEELHPETKATYEGGSFRGNQYENEVAADSAATSKSFVDDTAAKIGLSPRTVRERIQTARNLTPEAKDIIRSADTSITKTDALKLSRLEPSQQEDAAAQLVAGEISSVDEYNKPYSLGGRHFETFEDIVADIKNPDKDASYTAATLLAGLDGLIDNFHRDFAWYSMPMCTVAYPLVNQEQLEYIRKRFAEVTAEIEELLHNIEGSMINE